MHRIRTSAGVFMLLGAVLSAGGSASAVAAAPAVAKQSVAGCGSVSNLRVPVGTLKGADPNGLTRAQTRKAEKQLAARLKARGLTSAPGYTKAKVKIKVYVHVILRADGTGGVTKKQIKDQIAVLNAGYGGTVSTQDAPSIFSFATKAIDYTKNDDWYDWSYEGIDNDAAKAALHQGTMKDLNLYITGLADGLLGYSTFPFDTTLTDDGVVVLNQSLPGGTAAPYNEGDTLTHEAGHWLGLYHTFQNGCTAPGDYVKDTPAQADGDNIFDCVESDDTCTAPGTDPVHNFMSYGDDPCLDRFSAGQAKRMAQSWWAYRAHRDVTKNSSQERRHT